MSKLFKKILIANRGEIAVRIIRTCRQLGIKTVIVYSDGDKNTLGVKMADEAVLIGSVSPADSYLNVEKIIKAAKITNSEAIHPGFGFLAENAAFVKECGKAGVAFIGPGADHITKMGDKSYAKKTMQKANIPTIPGSKGTVKDIATAVKEAKKIGYPIMVKASAGGGGKGMRIVESEKDLKSMFNLAKREAKSFFGNDDLYFEKFIASPRHLEVQILADKSGKVVHLGERDCSIQRRYQKLLEESPSPSITKTLRDNLCKSAVKIAKTTGYENAGTIEFIVDSDNNFYFMEMNTRIQVEHPVTEAVTGIDIVAEQIKIAAGNKLLFSQKDVEFKGHSIECRINAEDFFNDFTPSPGEIETFIVPGGQDIRVDTHVHQGSIISPHYDSMIAKLIVHAATRDEAINKMRTALEEFTIDGINTTIPLHLNIMDNEDFISGNVTTKFINDSLKLEEQLFIEIELIAN
jgi:acetyl-CoA carboxylase biotin carboxylase subunit